MSEHQKEVRLATAALQAALAGKWERASRYLVRISEECGGDGLYLALIAWADTFIAHATDGDLTGKVGGISFIQTTTGQLDQPGSEYVPAEVQWAGRLIRARAALDETAWQAILDELPDDGYRRGAYVQAALQCVALTINGLPRGYARMGRPS